MLLNNQWITGEIKDFNKFHGDKKHNDPNVCYKAHKALLKEFIVISAYLKKQEKIWSLTPKGTRKRTNPKLEGKKL